MQTKWHVSLDKLQRRTGSKQERKHFAAHMRSMVQSNQLPDYALTLENDHVVFWRRGEAACKAKPTEAIAAPVQAAPPETKERRIMRGLNARLCCGIRPLRQLLLF
jgi:hypothetical protein